jgi:hypothetical protein
MVSVRRVKDTLDSALRPEADSVPARLHSHKVHEANMRGVTGPGHKPAQSSSLLARSGKVSVVRSLHLPLLTRTLHTTGN